MAENFFGSTDTGRIRKNNEDAFIAEKVLNNQFIAACVIDGVGGYEGGEVAAQIAKESISKHLGAVQSDILKLMRDALITANDKICQEKEKDKQNGSMACVLTLALINLTNNQFYYAHVGDTRLYLLRDHTLVKVTKDHSFVGFLEDSGRITEEAAMHHPMRHEINKALGFDLHLDTNTDYIETGTSPFLPGDMLLLCSDGLTDMVDRKLITSVLISDQPLSLKAKALIEAANEAGGKDNVTVVLVQNNKKPKKQKATRPVFNEKQLPLQKEKEAVTDKPFASKEETYKKGKSNRTLVIGLSVLSAALLIGFLWQLLKKANTKDTAQAFVNTSKEVIKKNRNQQEQKLWDSLQRTQGKVLSLNDSVYGKIIVVSDTLSVDKDSLHLKGHGIVLRSDSAYNGPALVVSAHNKYILLENIGFENFETGILLQNKGVHLKNVWFRNCRRPVQYGPMSRDSLPVTGKISDTLFIKNDSLPK